MYVSAGLLAALIQKLMNKEWQAGCFDDCLFKPESILA
jgi:hypothetical protein